MARKPLEPNLWTIVDMFKHIYTVPVYQRPYSWEQVQINTFLDDIMNTYSLPKSESEEGYFIGSIYIYDKDEALNGLIRMYDIIDGQQRMTTISLILLSIYSHAVQYNVAESDNTLMCVKQSLWKYVDRNYSKKNRTLTLQSIENKAFEALYDSCFDRPEDIKGFCDVYTAQNSFEKRVLDNFKYIYGYISSTFPVEKKNDLLDFTDYLLNHVQIIAIDSTCSISKAFSIFESINSKGKPLDEIDKIKTYIFSELDESSYDYYLKLWGNLIIKTNDRLYDYLYNYIKAYVSFYRQNIYLDNFKSLSKDELLVHYKKSNVRDALKALLEDMNVKVGYYNMLSDADKANSIVKNNEFRFFFSLFKQVGYKHPKPLFLRCLEEYDNKKLKKEDLVRITRETVKFMIEFLNISDRDSKDAITMFSVIMNEIYSRKGVDADVVENVIANEMISKAVTVDRIRTDLSNMDAYDQKTITAALLSLYEATTVDTSGKVKISYDKAYDLFGDYGSLLSLDHLLVQTPKADSEFMYYKDDSDKLVLKKGHDFDTHDIEPGMEYEQFVRIVLNRIGNLRLWYKDNNSARQNNVLQLNKYANFITFSQIKTRGEEIINTLLDKCLPMPVYNPNLKLLSSLKDNALPKMKKLIEYGIVKPGNELYITTAPNDAHAVLVDASYVEYNGNKIKINDWVCEITGWKSVNIYRYTAVAGEDETLHQKRLKYIMNHNEEALG